MSKVAELKVVPEATHDDAVLKRFEEAVEMQRAQLKKSPQAGFVMAVYTRSGLKAISVIADAYVYDPADYFFLPDLMKAEVGRLRDRSYDAH